MKLLFLSALYPPQTKGGGEISTHLIAQALVERGHEVTVVTSGDSEEERSLNGVRVLVVPLPLTAKPLLERRWAQRMASGLARYIEHPEDYDVVHAHDFRTAQILSELGWKRAVVTARDYAQICGSPNNLLADGSQCPGCERLSVVMRNQAVVEAPLPRRPFRAWQYWHNIDYRLSSFRFFKHQIFISQAQRNIIAQRQNLNGVETHVIYNPVPMAMLARQIMKPTGTRILYVGTVAHYKGVGLLLEAFREIAQANREVELHIIGEGDQRRGYEQMVKKWGLANCVQFRGRVSWEQLPQEYDQATVVVAPHIWIEPFGRTVVEAMARGRVVVAAQAGGPTEMIQDGQTGFLFERGSAESLREQLQKAVALNELQRVALGTAGQAWVQKQLDPIRIAEQHETAYRAIWLV